MLAEQRAERILAELANRRAVTVSSLCQVTGASEATIRRDLNALDRQGKLSKVHGGAVLLSGVSSRKVKIQHHPKVCFLNKL